MLSLAIADNKLFSGSYDYTIKVWSLDTLQRLKTLTGQPPTRSLCAGVPVSGRTYPEVVFHVACMTGANEGAWPFALAWLTMQLCWAQCSFTVN